MSAVDVNAVTLIERAILERLRTPRPYKPEVESYGAQLDDETFSWIRVLPAVWVTFDGAQQVERIGKRTWKYQGTFEVLAAQRALLQDARRLQDAATQDVGVYQLVHDNKMLLAGQKLGLPIGALSPGAIRSVVKSQVNRDAIAVYAQQFRTTWMEELPEDVVSPAGELMTVGFSYFLKPGDDVADRTDLLTTRTS